MAAHIDIWALHGVGKPGVCGCATLPQSLHLYLLAAVLVRSFLDRRGHPD